MIKVMANELKEILSMMSMASGGERTVETASNVFFTGEKIAVFSGDIFMEKPFETDFSGGVDSSLLKDIADKHGVSEIEVARNGNELSVKMKRSVSKLIINDVNQFPKIEFSENSEWRKVPAEFSSLLEQSSQFCGNNLNEPVKTCIHINGRYMEAGDGFHFAIFKMKGMIQDNIFIRKDFVKILSKFIPTEYRLSESWVCFRNENNYFLAVRKVDLPDYPDMHKLFDECKGETEIELDDKLISSLEKAKLFLKNEYEFDRFVKLKSEDKKLVVSTETKAGSYKDVIGFDGGDFDIVINPDYLMQMLFYSNKIIIGENAVTCEEKQVKMAACLAK